MEQKQITDRLKSFSLPEWNEIPTIGLYLDQVTKYINSYLEGRPGMAITGAMVSNYVKLKILDRAVNKAYSRDHIAKIFFIAISKSVLSMDQIRVCMSLQNDLFPIEEVYEEFRSTLTEKLASFGDDTFTGTSSGSGLTDGLDAGLTAAGTSEGSDADTLTATAVYDEHQKHILLQNISEAIAYKMFLDEYFATLMSELAEEEESLKDRVKETRELEKEKIKEVKAKEKEKLKTEREKIKEAKESDKGILQEAKEKVKSVAGTINPLQ